MKKIIVLLLCVVLLAGCITVRSSDRYDYNELRNRLYAVGLEPEKTKSPFIAGALNILPGIGNAYLGQWGLFTLNLLSWPLSILWGIPQAASDAKAMNMQDTLFYYQIGTGRIKLESIEASKMK